MNDWTVIIICLSILFVIIFIKTIRVVPQRSAFVVERLGKYTQTLLAGFHILVPFVENVAYKHTLKEQAVDVPSQTCITRDNIAVEVDGILYLQVMDAQKASYGIDDYLFASAQLAQTTMRSIIGKLELDKTFEERELINGQIVDAVDKASDPWGVKVTRYEVKNISPPQSIKDAMEKQMRAEREKRALIAESEGDKQAKINRAEGEKSELIAHSEGEKQKMINEAQGRASEIESIAKARASEIEFIAKATAEGIAAVANAIDNKNGEDAVNLRIAEQYIGEFGNLAKKSTSLIIPNNLSDIAGLVATAGEVLNRSKEPSKQK